MGTTAIGALMGHAIDYAGVFPPAQLSVADALAEYARVRDSAHGWMLGAFVVGSDRLDDVRTSTIPLSVVIKDASPDALAATRRAAQRLTIAALEYPPLPAADIPVVAAAAASPHTRLFFEVALQDLESALDAIAAAGAFAKLRTGGVNASAFPDAAVIDHFFRACVARQVPGKATAGLHHAYGGTYPLTYEKHSATSRMYGFVNVLGAAALVYLGAPAHDVMALLTEPSPKAVTISADALSWRGYRVGVADLQAVRRTLFLSFGSCSAQEPIDDLVRMQFL